MSDTKKQDSEAPTPTSVSLAVQGAQTLDIGDVSMIDAQVSYIQKIAKAVPILQAALIATTNPSDWVLMGKNLYLEGDGATKIGLSIGMRVLRTETTYEVRDDGSSAVTVEIDAECARFGNAVQGIRRTVSTYDKFLTQGKGAEAPIDKTTAREKAYKGAFARAVQFCSGLTGITPEDMKRYGFPAEKIDGVKYRTTEADAAGGAKKSAENVSEEAAKLGTEILKRVAMDKPAAGKLLLELTASPDGKFKGFDSVAKFTAQWQIDAAWKRLREHAAYGDKSQGDRQPGED